jgi:hypothetical protein
MNTIGKTGSYRLNLNDSFSSGDRVFIEGTTASVLKTGRVTGKWGNFGLTVLFDDRPKQDVIINLSQNNAMKI